MSGKKHDKAAFLKDMFTYITSPAKNKQTICQSVESNELKKARDNRVDYHEPGNFNLIVNIKISLRD